MQSGGPLGLRLTSPHLLHLNSNWVIAKQRCCPTETSLLLARWPARRSPAAFEHLAAVACHLARAARTATCRSGDRSKDDIESVDIPVASSSSSASSASSSDSYSNNMVAEVVVDMDCDLGDNVETCLAIVGHVYEWIGLLAGTVLLVPVYYMLLEVRRESAGWTWGLLGYALPFSLGVTFVLMCVFCSTCCLYTSLRALLLAPCLLVEIFTAFRLLLPTMLTTVGVVISIMHLLLFYLLAWNLSPPRRCRRR